MASRGAARSPLGVAATGEGGRHAGTSREESREEGVARGRDALVGQEVTHWRGDCCCRSNPCPAAATSGGGVRAGPALADAERAGLEGCRRSLHGRSVARLPGPLPHSTRTHPAPSPGAASQRRLRGPGARLALDAESRLTSADLGVSRLALDAESRLHLRQLRCPRFGNQAPVSQQALAKRPCALAVQPPQSTRSPSVASMRRCRHTARAVYPPLALLSPSGDCPARPSQPRASRCGARELSPGPGLSPPSPP